ncbi:Perilipin-3 [Neolecta irregularis DAH-3]|uniref:Perilipin-3 n=1 Tax=Neolecta irregularis (strain DAH-3) TaxID=1198029 RepID=A0A1U7LM99_NEOID|nr:Perilipin-3 [Neolecta irregularis DAH-3]|eukprot:OLL23769.1 Perilipin-3 [Neolecta irregularis DAH-3]
MPQPTPVHQTTCKEPLQRQYLVLSRLQTYPLVQDSYRVFNSYTLGKKATDTVKSISEAAKPYLDKTKPLLERAEPYLLKADAIACARLHDAEQRWPIIKAPSHEIYEKTTNPLAQPLATVKATVNVYTDAAKKNVCERKQKYDPLIKKRIDPYANPFIDRLENVITHYITGLDAPPSQKPEFHGNSIDRMLLIANSTYNVLKPRVMEFPKVFDFRTGNWTKGETYKTTIYSPLGNLYKFITTQAHDEKDHVIKTFNEQKNEDSYKGQLHAALNTAKIVSGEIYNTALNHHNKNNTGTEFHEKNERVITRSEKHKQQQQQRKQSRKAVHDTQYPSVEL